MTNTIVNQLNRLTNKVLSLDSETLFSSSGCYEVNDTKIISVLCPQFDKNLLSVSMKDGNLKISFYAENHAYFGYVDQNMTIPVGDMKVFDYFIIDNFLQIILKAN